MKKILVPFHMPCFVLIAGGLGLLLELVHMSAAENKDLTQIGYFSFFLLLALTAGVLVMLYLLSRQLIAAPKYSFNFPPSELSALGCLIGCLGLAVSSMMGLASAKDPLTMTANVFGLAGAAALVFLAHCRRTGTRPNTLFHVLLCLFFAMRLISLYRYWSSDPQVTDYIFHMLATIFLMLGQYQRACFDAGIGCRRQYAFYTLGSVYFCLLSLSEVIYLPIYLCCALWMLAEPCNYLAVPREAAEKLREEP